MHRPGCDPDHMLPTDFLCDFCERSWQETLPFIEGHHGSCICGECLRAANQAVQSIARDGPVPAPAPERTGVTAHAASGSPAPLAGHATRHETACTMCLEVRDEPGFASARRAAWICRRCIDQGVRVLSKDRSANWQP
ncbi:MAG: hypothetical protein KF724_06220 [Phycisphaeraceae bacterium]|nr:hypothetical protein [Phycisphaeraceae bacterium]